MRQGGTGAEARAEAWAQRIRGTEPRHLQAERPEAANARVWTRRARGLDRVLGHYAIADELFQLFDLREAPLFRSGPDHDAADAHVEDAAGSRHEANAANLALERGQELLGHPSRAQQPATLATVFDLHTRNAAHVQIVRPQRLTLSI